MSKGWMQFLFVALPVLSLVGSWLALRTIGERRRRRDKHGKDGKGRDERAKGE